MQWCWVKKYFIYIEREREKKVSEQKVNTSEFEQKSGAKSVNLFSDTIAFCEQRFFVVVLFGVRGWSGLFVR